MTGPAIRPAPSRTRPGDVAALYSDPVVAAGWDARRSRALFEAGWLRRALRGLPAGAAVLDLGCGAGEPIAAWLASEGYAVTGVDVSPSMLALARARLPGIEWILADMRDVDLGRRFGAVIAWDSLFHLDGSAQRMALARIAAHLGPGGRFLATVGPRAGEAAGRVGAAGAEREVYHASLSPRAYAAHLEDLGLEMTAFVAEDPDCGAHSILMARRPETR